MSNQKSIIDAGLFDFKKKRLTRDYFYKKLSETVENKKLDENLKKPILTLHRINICAFEAALTTASFLIPNFDVRKIKLFRWHGHATEERELDSRAGFLLTYEDRVIWEKLEWLS